MSLYTDLVNVEEFGKKKVEEFHHERGSVSFYCKDCRLLVETDRPNLNGYTFICKVCKGKNIAIGTQEGLKENYRIK